jgi:hypothetical protein
VKKFVRRIALGAVVAAGLAYARARLRAVRPTVAEPEPGGPVMSADLSPDEELNIVRVHNRYGQEALRQRIAEAAERDARGEQ